MLGNLAWILIARCEFGVAMGLLNEEERICRETGNIAACKTRLLYQANILHFNERF